MLWLYSDSFLPLRLPIGVNTNSDLLQQNGLLRPMKLTAAGLFGTCTRFHTKATTKVLLFFEIVKAPL